MRVWIAVENTAFDIAVVIVVDIVVARVVDMLKAAVCIGNRVVGIGGIDMELHIQSLP